MEGSCHHREIGCHADSHLVTGDAHAVVDRIIRNISKNVVGVEPVFLSQHDTFHIALFQVWIETAELFSHAFHFFQSVLAISDRAAVGNETGKEMDDHCPFSCCSPLIGQFFEF